jgi:Ca2+-binding RTX toxin-like protein
MALYELDRSELNSLLVSDHVDPSARKAIIDLLQDDGYFKGHGTVQVQEGGSLDSSTQVLIVDTPNATVTADSALKVIVDTADANLTVTGGNELFIVTNDDSGNGNDDGHGHGHDDDWSKGGGGNNTLVGGSGSFDTVIGGSGNDVLHGVSGSNNLLEGHGGNDTIFASTGVDTLHGGGGNDTFNVSTDTVHGSLGNDTISGGGGHDKVPFDVSSTEPPVSTDHGVTTVHFTGGQTTTINGVEQLVFTDQHVKH